MQIHADEVGIAFRRSTSVVYYVVYYEVVLRIITGSKHGKGGLVSSAKRPSLAVGLAGVEAAQEEE